MTVPPRAEPSELSQATQEALYQADLVNDELASLGLAVAEQLAQCAQLAERFQLCAEAVACEKSLADRLANVREAYARVSFLKHALLEKARSMRGFLQTAQQDLAPLVARSGSIAALAYRVDLALKDLDATESIDRISDVGAPDEFETHASAGVQSRRMFSAETQARDLIERAKDSAMLGPGAGSRL